MSEPRPTPALSREQMIDMLELALGDIDGDCCRDRTGGMVLAVLSALRAAPPPPAALPASAPAAPEPAVYDPLHYPEGAARADAFLEANPAAPLAPALPETE